MIPVCEPLFTGKELQYTSEAIDSTWIGSRGKFIERFEKEFPAYLAAQYGTLTTSGTTALHLALQAMGVGAGDEVLMPDFTMIASANAICYCGAKPVFVDAERETWNMDPALIEEKITPRSKAIMVVHIYGHPCEMDSINALARHYNLLVIEDAAEAIGSRYKGRMCGSLGDLAAFSFFANKMITCGEGGMVCTSSEELYDKLRYYKNLCFPLDGPRVFRHEHIGFNYRMTNTHAAILCAQLEEVERFVEARRSHAHAYTERLREVPGLQLPPEKEGMYNSYWMYGLLVEDSFPLSRDELAVALKKEGIDTRPFFVGMHRQGGLRRYGCDCTGSYPVTDDLAAKGLYLPSGSGLQPAQIDFICDTLKQVARV